MDFKSKNTQLLLLVVTALTFSRTMFAFFNDPEGPNLLIVTVAAAILYVVSLVAYASNLSTLKKLLLAIGIQVVVVIGSYLYLS